MTTFTPQPPVSTTNEVQTPWGEQQALMYEVGIGEPTEDLSQYSDEEREQMRVETNNWLRKMHEEDLEKERKAKEHQQFPTPKSKFSFDFNASTTSEGFANQKQSPTAPQLKYYADLCEQRGFTPQDTTSLSYDEVSELIKKVKSFYPASEKQIELIKTKIDILIGAGVKITQPSPEQLSKLTGGKEGSASSLINSLIEQEKTLGDSIPPTEKQLGYLVTMYHCPEVPFEQELSISRKVDLGQGLWRQLTPDEFADKLEQALTRKSASKFIDQYRGAHHTWLQTRIRPEQEKYIRDLESKLSNTYVAPEVEFAIVDGVITQVTKPSARKSYNPKGHEPLGEFQLKMMSKVEASKYIDILKSDLENKDLRSTVDLTPATDQHDYEQLRKLNEVDAEDKELQDIRDLTYKIFAMAGFDDDAVIDSISMKLTDDNSANRVILSSFLTYIIESGDVSIKMIEKAVENNEFYEVLLAEVEQELKEQTA